MRTALQREPALPQGRAAEQGFVGQRRGIAAEQAARGVGRPEHDQRRIGQAHRLQPAPAAAALAQRGMKALALQVDDVLRGVQLDADVGVLVAPAAHARQQPALRERRQQGDADALLFVARRRRRSPQSIVELRQRRLHRAQQRSARGVEHDAAAAAIEQRKTDLLFEQLDLLADGAVRQVQGVGGRAQVGAACDGTKGGQGLERQAGHGGIPSW